MKYLVILLALIGVIGTSYAYEPEPVGVDMIEYGIFDPNDNNTHLLKVGTTYDIKAHFKSELDKQVPFRFLVRVLDKDKHWTEPVDEFVSTGTLKPNESKQITFSWTPQYQGQFRTYVEVSNPDTHGAMGYAPQFDFEVIKPDADDPFHDYFPTYRIMNLKEQYLIDEPIRPYILKKDLHACNAYRAEILKDDRRVWEYTIHSSCIMAVEPFEIESEIQIPETHESIKLSEAGHYTLEIEIGSYELQENFSVVEHATENPDDNFKYPVPGGGIISDMYPVRKQFEMGIKFENLKCNEGHVLIQKYDRTPACVTESTKTKLTDRGWTLINYQAVLEDTKKLDYVKEFLAKYPHARERLLEDSKTVYYETWGIRPDYGIDDKIMAKRLVISLDNPMKPRITCGSGITMESTDVKRFLNQKDWCFSEKYSAETLTFGKARDIADSNMSHSEKIKALERYATEDLDGLLFTASFAAGLKEQYEYGEDIDFEVTQYGYEIPCISPNIKVYLDGYERPIFEDHVVYPCPYFSEPSGIVNTWSTDEVFDLFPHCRYNGVHSLVTHTKSSGSIEIGKYYCNGQETFLPPAIHTIIIPKGTFDESLQKPLLPNELNVRWGDYLRFDNRADSKLRVVGDSPRDSSPTTVEFSYTLEPNDSETVRIVYDGVHWIRVETVDKQIIPWLNGTINVR